jgi:hypothetical protein
MADAMNGLLAGNGTAMVHALVFHHPTPQQTPPGFAELANPVPGADGRIQDWQLSMRKLLANRGEHVHDVWSSFAMWRHTFVADRVLGDVATVTSFLRWADGVCDVSTLHPLNLGSACIPAKAAARVAWQAHESEVACRQRGEAGLGVTVPQRAGLVRGFVLQDKPVLVLGDGEAAVSAVATGLEVANLRAGSAPATLLVQGWVVDAGGVTAISAEGPVPMGGTTGGRLLARVVPGVANASVGPATLSAIFSGLLVGLRECAQLAASDLVPLWIRTGNVGPTRYVVR